MSIKTEAKKAYNFGAKATLKYTNTVANGTRTPIIGGLSNTINSIQNKDFAGSLWGLAETGVGAGTVVLSIFCPVAGTLLCAVSNFVAAIANATLGQTISDETDESCDKISQNLSAKANQFSNGVGQITQGLQKCGSVAKQATSTVTNAMDTVSGNGEMVGVNVNLDSSALQNQSGAGNNIQEGGMAGNNTGGAINGAANAGAITQAEVPVPINQSPSIPKADDGSEKVYSCDWGNGAKSAEEIAAMNGESAPKTKSNKDVKNAEKNSGKDKGKKNGLDKKLGKLDAERKKILDKLNQGSEKENEDDVQNELKARVQNDAAGMSSTLGQNQSGISQEEQIKAAVNNNVNQGKNAITQAQNLSQQAQQMGAAASQKLNEGASENESIADLFKDPLKISEALAGARKAADSNKSANSDIENANATESQSREQQQLALTRVQTSLENLLPKYEQSAQSRLEENVVAQNTQNETRKVIEKSMNSDNNEYLGYKDLLNNINSEENMLASNYSRMQDRQNSMKSIIFTSNDASGLMA